MNITITDDQSVIWATIEVDVPTAAYMLKELGDYGYPENPGEVWIRENGEESPADAEGPDFLHELRRALDLKIKAGDETWLIP